MIKLINSRPAVGPASGTFVMPKANAIGSSNYQVEIGKTIDEVEEIIIVGIKNSSTPGVKIVEYKIPALDITLKTTGALKGDGAKPFIKTIYDPIIWPDAKLEIALQEAILDAANKGKFIENKFISGLTKDGYVIEFIVRNGKVKTFYFKETNDRRCIM